MAGTIPLSLTQQFDVYGAPLAGGQLYIIQVGTVSTPQNAYQDTGLSITLPYPITLDAAGRVPQFFLADGSVKIRLQDRYGVVQLASDSVLVIGPSAGGGGGSTVDPTQLISTGMMMFAHSTASIAGFVRLNAKTIGSSTSGATERANADTQALFLYLWPDTTLTVSGGRGGSAAADWAANKQLSLPDWRGYALNALDDMGNTAAGRLTASYFGASPIVLGAAGGSQTQSVVLANLPPYTPAGSVGVTAHGSVDLPFNAGVGYTTGGAIVAYQRSNPNVNDAKAVTVTIDTATFNGTAQGGGAAPFANMGPRKCITFYMKL
jgi:hypothetical protein